MINDINLPVMYGVLELKEDGSYLNGYSDITRGFIASKCYVLEESIRYNKDGSNYKIYRVLYPYKDLEAFKLNCIYGHDDEINPDLKVTLDICGNLKNVDIVENIYEDYNSARVVANRLNEELINKEIDKNVNNDILYDKNSRELREKLEYEMGYCDMFEYFINNSICDNSKKLILK